MTASSDLRDVIRGNIRIIYPKKGKSFDRWVTKSSPKWQRVPITQIRRYLSHECGYDMCWDESDRTYSHAEAYTFTHYEYNERRHEGEYPLVGAAIFNIKFNPVELHFCWIHPFYRNQGLFTKAWPDFIARYNIFRVDQPSYAMRGVLSTLGYVDPTLENE